MGPHLGTDTKQCVAVLRLTSTVLRAYGWRCEGFAASQVTKLTDQGLLSHPYKQVRVEVGQLLAIAMTAAPAAPSCEALISEMTRLCTPATTAAAGVSALPPSQPAIAEVAPLLAWAVTAAAAEAEAVPAPMLQPAAAEVAAEVALPPKCCFSGYCYFCGSFCCCN